MAPKEEPAAPRRRTSRHDVVSTCRTGPGPLRLRLHNCRKSNFLFLESTQPSISRATAWFTAVGQGTAHPIVGSADRNNAAPAHLLHNEPNAQRTCWPRACLAASAKTARGVDLLRDPGRWLPSAQVSSIASGGHTSVRIASRLGPLSSPTQGRVLGEAHQKCGCQTGISGDHKECGIRGCLSGIRMRRAELAECQRLPGSARRLPVSRLAGTPGVVVLVGRWNLGFSQALGAGQPSGGRKTTDLKHLPGYGPCMHPLGFQRCPDTRQSSS